MPIWELGAHESDVTRLNRRLLEAAKGKLDEALLGFHQDRATLRGAAAWEPGSNLSAADQLVLPDFTLGPLTELFGEGVAPHVAR